MAGGTKKPWDRRRLRLQSLLRDIRTSAGLLQADLGKRIGADQSFVSRYERGERRLDLVELEQILVEIVGISDQWEFLGAHDTDRPECGWQHRDFVHHPVFGMATKSFTGFELSLILI